MLFVYTKRKGEMNKMKKAKIVTAMTATALALNLVGITANAEVAPTTEVLTTGVVNTEVPAYPFNDVLQVKLEGNKTYTYSTTIKEGSTVQYDAQALVPRADGETGLPPEYLNFEGKATLVVKDNTGKVVLEAVETAKGDLETEYVQLPGGEYTVEFTTKEGTWKEGAELVLGNRTELPPSDVKITAVESSVDLDKLYPGVETILTGVDVKDGLLTQVEMNEPDAEDYKLVQEFSPDKGYKFKPEKEGMYTFKFTVKDAETGETAETVVEFYIYAKDDVNPPVDENEDEEKPSKPTYTKASGLKMKVAKTTVEPKSNVTVTHSAKGTAVKYKVAIKQKGERNKVVKDYTSSKKVVFKAPSKKGKYIVSVYAKSSKGGKAVHTTKVITVK